MATGQVRRNGVAYDWGDIIIKPMGQQYEGITGIKYGQKRTRPKLTGNTRDRKPIGIGRGKTEADDATLTCWKSTAAQIRADAAAYAAANNNSDGTSYGDAIFPITVQYSADDGSIITDELIDCWIAGDDSQNEDNADALKEEMPLGVSAMTRNGLTLHSPEV